MSAPISTSCRKMSPANNNKLFYFAVVLLSFMTVQLSNSKDESNFYSFAAVDIQGRVVSLENFRGKPSLVVNVASACGYTNQHYSELAWLYEQKEFEDKLNILAFPCNQFGQQERGTHRDIERLARDVFQATFPIFAKIDVIGEKAHPVYKYLAEKTGKEPTWNFWKYLVDRDGQVLHAWGPKVSVLDLYSQLYNIVNKKTGTTEDSETNAEIKEDSGEEETENGKADEGAEVKEEGDKEPETKESNKKTDAKDEL